MAETATMRPPVFVLVLGMVAVSILILFGAPALYQVPRGAYRFEPAFEVRHPDGSTETVDRGWYRGAVGNRDYIPGAYTLTLKMNLDGLPQEGGGLRYLVVPYISGTAIRVSLNGVFVGAQGDVVGANSNIWYSAKRFILPEGVFADNNTLTAEIQGPYEVGLPMEPYILEKNGYEWFLLLLEFLSDKIVWILAGAVSIMGCSLLLIGSAALPRIDPRAVLGAAAVVTALFLSDFMTFEALPVPLVEFKRGMVILRHLGALLFSLGYFALMDRKLDRFIRTFVVLQALSIFLLLFPRDMIALKNMYTYTFLTMSPLPFYLMYLMLRFRDEWNRNLLLLSGVMVGSAAAIRDALVPILYPGSVYVSHYGFMVMILTSTGFVVMDVVHHYRLLLSERLRADRYQSESMRDPLTGAYNRNMLDVVMEGLDGPFSVVFLDLNNFKAVNDTHGHSAGDAVLSDVVRIMGSVFRRDDAVIRTGGDEFLAVLPHCPKEKAEALTRQLEAEASASSIITESGTILKYSVSLASASYTGEGAVSPGLFSEILSAADRAMYEHKQRVKRGLR